MSVAARDAMFREGARALARVVPDLPGEFYACPLCLVGYPIQEVAPHGALTMEHVPPESVGGRPLCLTCRRCNSTAGSQLDAHMERYDAQVDFFAGIDTRDLRATFSFGGKPQRGVVAWRNGGMSLLGVRKRDRPAVPEEMIEHADAKLAAGDTNWTIGITFEERWSKQRVQVGWLRSAYLAAFAALGYSYIARHHAAPEPTRDEQACVIVT